MTWLSSPSSPASRRPSKPWRATREDADARDKPAHDETGCSGTLALLRHISFVAVVIASLSAALANGFVVGTEDVPLMPGLAPVPGSSLVFDKPEGRIVEAQASGKV